MVDHNNSVPQVHAHKVKHVVDASGGPDVHEGAEPAIPLVKKQTVKTKASRKTKLMAPPRSSPIRWRYPLAKYRYVRGYSLTDWKRPHRGVDLAAPSGDAIYAMAAGTVLHSGRMGSYGKMVVIDHGQGFSSVYAHASRSLVDVGQKVRSGQKVALVGSTGRSTGPHLHFEIRYNGKAVDPEGYIRGLKKNSTK
jgi:murein DD-endopeptidase MepM/ murein hydrolase activator NlpD